MAFCYNCGYEIQKGYKFCFNCGQKIEIPTYALPQDNSAQESEKPEIVEQVAASPVEPEIEPEKPVTPIIKVEKEAPAPEPEEAPEPLVIVDTAGEELEYEEYEDDEEEYYEDEEEEYDEDPVEADTSSVDISSLKDPQTDEYWNDVVPEIEDELDKIPKDIILKIVGIVIAVLLVIAWLVYML